MSRLSRTADIATIAVSAVALLLAGSYAFSRTDPPSGGQPEDRDIAEWRRFADEGHSLGPENAAVTILEFGDYECPYCRRIQPALEHLLSTYPQEVRLVYRHYPLDYHPNAYRAARFAECAAEQGAFWPMHDALYSASTLSELTGADYAERLSLGNAAEFMECVDRNEPHERIEADLAAVEALAIRGTPGFVINGHYPARTPDSLRLTEYVEGILSKVDQ